MKYDSDISGENKISPDNESLSPHMIDLSPQNSKLSPKENQDLSTKTMVFGDNGDNYKIIDSEDKSNKVIKETPKSETDQMIGYRGPFHHCKQHPHVQNINKEEIKRHILYSKDNQPSS